MEGERKAQIAMLHPPYKHTFFIYNKFKDYAHPVKDLYSGGVVIAAVLGGQKLVIPAYDDDLLERMIGDLSQHLGANT